MTVLSCMLSDAALGDNPIQLVELSLQQDGLWRAVVVRANGDEFVEGARDPAAAAMRGLVTAMGLVAPGVEALL